MKLLTVTLVLSLSWALTFGQANAVPMFDLIAPDTLEEGRRTEEVTISLVSGSRPGTDVDITFNVSGTATAGADYVAPRDCTYRTGEPNNQTCFLQIKDDNLAEPAETIILTASVLDDSALFSTDTATITLNDNDAAFFELTPINFEVNESAGSAVAVVELSSADITFDIEVTLQTVPVGRGATEGDDYTATSVVLTFMSGDIVGATQNVSIPIINDLLVENTEVFDVQLSVPGRVLPRSTISILDDDKLFFELTTANVVESAGSAVAVVELRSTEIAFDVEVTLQTVTEETAGSQATEGDDYTATSVVLTFMSGDIVGAKQNVSIPIINDNLVENTEVFDVQLSDSGTVLLRRNISIVDDDIQLCVGWSVNSSSLTVLENEGPARLTLQLQSGDGSQLESQPYIVTLTVTTLEITGASDAAEAPEDYTPQQFEVTIPAGELSVEVVIPIIDDIIPEGLERFQVMFNVIDEQDEFIQMCGANTTTVTIVDNDLNCTSDEFICDNGECIDASGRCNGSFDCSDSSDETECTDEDDVVGVIVGVTIALFFIFVVCPVIICVIIICCCVGGCCAAITGRKPYATQKDTATTQACPPSVP